MRRGGSDGWYKDGHLTRWQHHGYNNVGTKATGTIKFHVVIASSTDLGRASIHRSLDLFDNSGVPARSTLRITRTVTVPLSQYAPGTYVGLFWQTTNCSDDQFLFERASLGWRTDAVRVVPLALLTAAVRVTTATTPNDCCVSSSSCTVLQC